MTNGALEKAYYGVHIDLAAVGVDIRVNDMPLYSDYKSGQLTVEFPCPELIKSGINELTVSGHVPVERDGTKDDAFCPGAYVTARLFYQKNDDAEKDYLIVLKLQANENGVLEQVQDVRKTDQEPVEKRNGDIEMSATYFGKIKAAFPPWAWETGVRVEKNDANFDSLLMAYKQVYDALAANDQPLLRKLYSKRAEEMAIIYHLDGVDAGHEWISTGKDAQNQDLALHDFYTKDLALQIFANGKLARLMNPSGVQPIVYVQKNPRLTHIHKFMFYKNENNQWVMIR